MTGRVVTSGGQSDPQTPSSSSASPESSAAVNGVRSGRKARGAGRTARSVSGTGASGGSADVTGIAGTGLRNATRGPRVTKARRSARSSRSASSRGDDGAAVFPASEPVSDSSQDRRPTRSRPGDFVDARGLKTDRAVGERLRSGDGSGPFLRPKVIGFTARAREERKARALTMLIRVGVAALAAGIVGALIWLLFFSPVLKLESDRIRVQGANEWVSAEQVSAIADEQVGRSLIVVSTGTIADRLKAMPGVTSAQVNKQWPHGLTITVAAQKPAAVLKSADGAMTAVDSQARVLNAVGASVAGIPVIDVDSVSAGLENRAVQQALQILAALPESMRQRISAVTAKTQDSVTTVLDGGNYTIVWGDASQLTLKKAEVNAILGDPAVIGDKHHVDVTSPRKPIIK